MIRVTFSLMLVLWIVKFPLGASSAPGRSAWAELIRQDPGVVDDAGVSRLDRMALNVLTPEQGRAYLKGAKAEDLVLEDGQTLAEYLRERLAPPAGVFVILPGGCDLLAAEEIGAGEVQAVNVRQTCGIPREATALLVMLRMESPNRLRVKLWAADLPEPAEAVWESSGFDLEPQAVTVVGLCEEEACPEGDLALRATENSVLRAQALGYFRALRIDDNPGRVIPFSTESGPGTYNDFFGYQAGGNATGDYNAFFGRRAGYGGTGTDNTGTSNTYVGYDAGWSNTSGSENAFFGRAAGYSNTTGIDNAFFGYRAGYTNTTGSTNTYVGAYAGHDNSTGANNVFVGSHAGYSNTTSSGNAYFGREAGLNATGDSNTYIGYRAGYGGSAFADNTGTLNTYVGYEAGYSNTTGTGNAFFGYRAGYENVGGNGNTAFGQLALSSNVISSFNSVFGYQAGALLNQPDSPFADENSLFGYQAGYYVEGSWNSMVGALTGRNATGSSNALFGYQAGYGGTGLTPNSGNNNSYFGYQSGYSNTTGSSNAYFGHQSGYSNTSGTENAFFGTLAGNSNTSGDFNSVFGTSAGFNNTSGDQNAFFGYFAGLANTLGSFNAFFGASAGDSNTVETRNTFLGSYADLDSSVSSANSPVTNATAVGHRAFVSQSNSLVLGSIAGVNSATDSVNVGIGTTAPEVPLHVQTTLASGAQLKVVDQLTGGYFSVIDGKDAAYFPLFWFSGVGTNGNGGGFVSELPVANDVFSGNEKAAIVLEGRRSNGTNLVNTNILAVRNKWTPALWLTASGNLYTTGSITPGSSRELKEQIERLELEDAIEVLAGLDPVTFRYKEDREKDLKVGFIAEDVPELVATPDRKGVSSMDIVGILTRVVQEQQNRISRLEAELAEIRSMLSNR